MQSQCLTLPLLLMEVIVFLVTCGIIFWEDYSNEKNPFDAQRKKFLFKQDYWPFRKDDICKKWLWGALGALLAPEVGMYVVHQFTDLPEVLEDGIDLTLIFICTYFAQKIFQKN